MASSRVTLFVGGLVLEQVPTRVHMWQSSVVSTTSSTTDLGGMAQQSFDDEAMWMDACRMVALSGVVVTWTVVWHSEMNALITTKDGSADLRTCACGARRESS